MQRTKIAINGVGRIGRALFKLALTRKELEILAINDLGDIENLAYLLQYDSAYGRYNKEVKVESGKLKVDGREMLFIQEKDPTMLPWKALDIDIVVEATEIYDNINI